jgi:hypothetical protein
MSDEQVAESAEEAAPVQEESTEEVVEEQGEEEAKFSKAQMQQVGSVMGNMIKKAIEDSVLPLINKKPDQDPYVADSSNPAFAKFNEQLTEKILSGDVMGALDDYQKVKERANKNLTNTQTQALNKEMNNYTEKEHYKDVYADMKTLSTELVTQGWPPKAAAEHAYTKATLAFLKGGSIPDGGAFEMTTGGRRVPAGKKPKLPPNFKAAYERDKAKGLFKTEQEFIDNLAPQIKAELGF